MEKTGGQRDNDKKVYKHGQFVYFIQLIPYRIRN